MTNKLSLITTAIGLVLLTRSTAQLVFVPDMELRTYLDSVIPGVVDANGYIDSGGALALSAQELTIFFDWSPADITGVEALTNLEELHLLHDETGVAIDLTVASFPANLVELEIWSDFSISLMPQFPASLEVLRLGEIYNVPVLPPLPAGLSDLTLVQMMDLLVVPTVPDTMHLFGMSECIALQSITNMPSVAWGVYLGALPVTSLPACPNTVLNEISLQSLYNLTQTPEPPDSVGYKMSYWNLPLIDSIPQLPGSCPRLRFQSMPTFVFMGNWPTDLNELEIEGGGPSCLQPLPTTLTQFQSEMSAVTCLPNLPPNAQIIWDLDLLTPNEVPLCNLLNTVCDPVTNGIGGKVYLDQNGNGAFDIGEPPFAMAVVETMPGNWMTGVLPNGSYTVGVPVGSYAINCAPDHPYLQSVSPAQHSASFPAWNGVDTLNDFGVILQPNIQDLSLHLTSIVPPVPGFDVWYNLHYTNAGTQVQDGSVTFTYDATLTFISSVPAPDVINGNTLTWNFTQLAISEQRNITVTMSTPVGTALGTNVYHTAMVGPLATDQAPNDNTDTYDGVVVNGFDPNDKTVSPTELTPTEVSAGERVTYTVRFQNTGTYQAFRVVITDTLSSDLQWNTMHLLAASHAHTWYIENGVLFVVFDNINLPDSNANEPESHGFVKFSMKPVSTLMLGASVSNTANIYFDFNEPVITNAAVFTVDDNTATTEVERAHMQLSPNPVSDALTVIFVQPEQGALFEVVDVTGRVVFATVVSGTQAVLDVQSLKPGSYHVRLGDRLPGRFVKR